MKTVEGRDVSEKFLRLLDEDEALVFAACPSYATVRVEQHWAGAFLLLTNRRILICKDRMFGKARADFEANWAEVSTVEGSLWNGGGPKIQLLVFNSATREPVELIVDPLYAVEVESAIRSGYLHTES